MRLGDLPKYLEAYGIAAHIDSILGYPRVKMDYGLMSIIQILLVGAVCQEHGFEWWVVNDLINIQEGKSTQTGPSF